MVSAITREEALTLLKEYNKEPFHILHGLTVEGVMRWYAKELGYADEEEYWGIVGLLHDIDFELYPGEHCKKAPELLRKGNVLNVSWKKNTDTDLLGYNIFERIAKEGRKYGLVLNLISQRPVEISETVISQCTNFFIFKMKS